MEQHIIDNLKSLKSLLDSGILSAEEFDSEKEKILRGEVKNESQIQASPAKSEKRNELDTNKTLNQSYVPKTITIVNNNLLLWWAVIYFVASVVAEFIQNTLNIWSGESVVSRNIFFLLLIIRHISNILPTLVIKNKTYKIPCAIGMGLLSLYYVYQIIQN